MKIHTFIFQILQKMQKEFEDEATVSVQNVTKNNGVVLSGLTFTQKDVNISPTIYLEDFYKEYEEGREMEDIVEELKEIYYNSKLEKDIDMNFFTNYDIARKNIVYKLINYEKNKVLLEEIPHKKYLDFAIVFYYLVDIKEFANATILIHNKHLAGWQVDVEQLYLVARENTPRLLKANFCGMMDILQELSEEDYYFSGRTNKSRSMNEEDDYELWMEMHIRKDETGMYVLSNFSRLYGAGVILYDGVLESCAKQLGADLYILPSSVHEVILIPDEGQITKEKLEQMVREVNETQVEEQELLSDYIYYFSRREKKVQRL